jgi:hypothetical protein
MNLPRGPNTFGVGAMRALGYFSVTVRDDERAFLLSNGRFVKLLGPGRHRELDPFARLSAEVVKVLQAELSPERALLYARMAPALAAEHFAIVQPKAREVAIVSLDGVPRHLVLPHTTRAFWKTLTAVDVETIDTAADLRVSRELLHKLDIEHTRSVVAAVVASHETGLLFVDGEFVEELAPGRHAFWAVGRRVEVAKVDRRPTPLEVTAQ